MGGWGVKLYIIVNTGTGNSIPRCAHLLGCILIARGAGVEQRRQQRFLVFVNMIPPPCWRHSQQLQTVPGLGEVKMLPRLRHNCSHCWECWTVKEEPGGSATWFQVPCGQPSRRERSYVCPAPSFSCELRPVSSPTARSLQQSRSVEMQMHLEPGVCRSLSAREARSLDLQGILSPSLRLEHNFEKKTNKQTGEVPTVYVKTNPILS